MILGDSSPLLVELLRVIVEEVRGNYHQLSLATPSGEDAGGDQPGDDRADATDEADDG